MTNSHEIGGKLLIWYEAHARELPWRARPGCAQRVDPYRVWLSEIMLQQTTVVTVVPYFEAFLMRWPDVQALAGAPDEAVLAAWAGLGYYARARNLIKCARMVAANGGMFPDTEAGLLGLPGIGPYTAAAIAAIAFGRAAVVVDGNIERVMARLFDEQIPLPQAKPLLKMRAAALTPSRRAGDHAQALMDLGATVCIPKAPRCEACPLAGFCVANKAGRAAELPRRQPKKPKPLRRGYIFHALREDGTVLLETRPPRGLLGGMQGLVGSDWQQEMPPFLPPLSADWQEAEAKIYHIFTHFSLELTLMAARVGGQMPRMGAFVPPVPAGDLPSVMRKAYLAGQRQLS
ncbi:MAG: A/G-specific adenine glycosylase [Rhodobacteraceae bacterium]|nr:A/G-specific adenine glycosylase [Paracoccaceae bacterium]